MTRPITRRQFLRYGATATASLTVLPASLHALGAALNATDYKALVCVFLYGGNDGFNLLIPDNDYDTYATGRGAMAIDYADILPLLPQVAPPDGRTYGFHPSLPELQNLFNSSRELAILANVGTLVEPVTRDAYENGEVQLPFQLFSHNDQQLQWQASLSRERPRTGWGGRLADLTHSRNPDAQVTMSMSLSGSNFFQVGKSVNQYHIAPDGLVGFDDLGIPGFTNELAALERLLEIPETNLFHGALADVTRRAIRYDRTLSGVLDSAPPLSTIFPETPLAEQLAMVAKLLSVREELSLHRQVFFCALGGFDTHEDQLAPQADLLQQLSGALQAFRDATVELGIAETVTTFTASDFGRTFTSNGRGTDHGWGNIHLVLGGAVRGGRFYGAVPDMTLEGPDDAGRGRWIPTTAVDQVAATLASWFGVEQTDLPYVVPNLSRFSPADLGFFARV